jgi:hypothetical protein
LAEEPHLTSKAEFADDGLERAKVSRIIMWADREHKRCVDALGPQAGNEMHSQLKPLVRRCVAYV